MSKKSRKAKTILSETSPAVAQPAPSNPSASSSSYLPLQPAGSPVTLESILAAVLNTDAKVGSALERINKLQAKIFELQEAAANDTSMVDKLTGMEAKVQDLQETVKNTIESDFSAIETLKTLPKLLKHCQK